MRQISKKGKPQLVFENFDVLLFKSTSKFSKKTNTTLFEIFTNNLKNNMMKFLYIHTYIQNMSNCNY